jgi:hypothetical protein
MGGLTGLALSADSSALAVMNVLTRGIAGYSIDAEGNPSPQGEFVVAPGMSPSSIIPRPDNDQLFALWSSESASALMKITFAFGSGSAGGKLYNDVAVSHVAAGFGFSSDGKVAYIGSSKDSQLSIFDVAVSGQPTERLGSPYTLSGPRQSTCVQASADGAHLVILDAVSAEVSLVNLVDAKLTATTTDIGLGSPLGMASTL